MTVLLNVIATLCTMALPFVILSRLYMKREYAARNFLTGMIVSFVLNYLILTFYNSYFQSLFTIDSIFVVLLWMGLAALIEYLILYLTMNRFIKDRSENGIRNTGLGYSSLYNILFLGIYSAEMLMTIITLYVEGEAKIEGYHEILASYQSIDINLFIILSLQAIIHILMYQKVCAYILDENRHNRIIPFFLIFEFCFVTKFLVSYSILLTYLGIIIEIVTLITIYKPFNNRRINHGTEKCV